MFRKIMCFIGFHRFEGNLYGEEQIDYYQEECVDCGCVKHDSIKVY